MLSILYVTWSGVFVVKMLIPQGFHGSFVQVVADNEQEKIIFKKQAVKDQLHDLIFNNAVNENIILRIANNTYVALTLLRNGIILFACYFITAFAIKTMSQKPPPLTRSVVEIKINDSTEVELKCCHIRCQIWCQKRFIRFDTI
jgi:hypothetical protein